MSIAPSQSELDAVKRQFYEEGVSVVDWARQRGFDVHLVYSVLSGRSRASRGESHRIAVALGLKSSRPPSLAIGGADTAARSPEGLVAAMASGGRHS